MLLNLELNKLSALTQPEFKNLIDQIEDGAHDILLNGSLTLAEKANELLGALCDMYYHKFINPLFNNPLFKY